MGLDEHLDQPALRAQLAITPGSDPLTQESSRHACTRDTNTHLAASQPIPPPLPAVEDANLRVGESMKTVENSPVPTTSNEEKPDQQPSSSKEDAKLNVPAKQEDTLLISNDGSPPPIPNVEDANLRVDESMKTVENFSVPTTSNEEKPGQQPSSSKEDAKLNVPAKREDTLLVPIASSEIESEQQPSSGSEDTNLLESTKPEDSLLVTVSAAKDEPSRQPAAILFSRLEDLDPDDLRVKKWRAFKSRREVVLYACFLTALIICITNFTLAALGWSRYQRTQDGVVVLYHGDCNIVKRADTGLHVLINLLGTLLFGVSNLTMQLLATPTRKDVDKAHSKASWVDIGVPSFRNLRQISRLKCLMWCCLALSSIPIHFLYNSTVFSSLNANGVAWVIARESFLDGPLWTNESATTMNQITLYYDEDRTASTFEVLSGIHNDYRNTTSLYENHTSYDCLKTYMNPLDWRPRLLILISSDEFTAMNGSTYLDWGIRSETAGEEAHFLCDGDPTMSQKCAAIDALTSETIRPVTFRGRTIEYCLFKPVDIYKSQVKTCHLQGSPQILLVVAIFNTIKCLCILWVMLFDRGPTLCTLGDAIASFLQYPDKYTRGLGITSKADIVQSRRSWSASERSALSWHPHSVAWQRAASKRRWMLTIVTSLIILIAGWIVIGHGLAIQRVYHRSISLKSLWAMGFGETNVDEIVSWNQATKGQLGLFVNILIANIWQVVVSLAYIAHNSLLSCMLVADEWVGFATNRKTLRVSIPQGIQRSSYTLSIPFRYSIPMLATFSVMHWLLSQATFIIRLNRITWKGEPATGWTTGGYSLFPGLMASVLFLLILTAQILHGFLRKYPKANAMPLASTCSAAISAACHRPETDTEAHLLPVQWGVIDKDESGRGLCAFTTAANARPPKEGELYLGISPGNRRCGETLPSHSLPMESRQDGGEQRKRKRFWKIMSDGYEKLSTK